jgi:hypothetical protein
MSDNFKSDGHNKEKNGIVSIKEAICEFNNLDLLNKKYDFDKFTKYIMSKNVIMVTKTLLNSIYYVRDSDKKIDDKEIGNTIKENIFLSIWLIYHFSDSILNYNIEIEKSIKSHCNSIISIISTLSISDKEETINIINLFHSYNALFNKWKLYDKNISIKQFIERYCNISKSIDLICNNKVNKGKGDYSDNEISCIMENSLYQQQKDVINLALKYDKKYNLDYFKKHYEIIKNIEKVCDDAYWTLVKNEFNNKNYDLFYKNINEIKSVIIELNGNNVHNINIINNTITTTIIKNNLFIYKNDDKNIIIDICSTWYKHFCIYILTELKKLSSPIRDIEYDQYISQLLSITPSNYNEKLAEVIKICYKIIDSMYLDLLMFAGPRGD